MDVLQRLEPSSLTLGRQFAAGVAAHMAEEPVVVVVGAGARRNDDHDAAAGRHDPRHLAQRTVVVGDVLKQVGADNRTHGCIADRKRACIGLQQTRRRHEPMGLAQTCSDQVSANQQRVWMGMMEVLEQVSGGASDVSDRRLGRKGSDPSDDRAAGLAIDEMSA